MQGSLLLTIGEAAVYGSSFLRNMILARVLTKADFGIAATFSLVITLFEFSAKVGVGQFVVRDKDGDESEFIATAHLVQFAAAMLGSVLIAACAGPLSRAFGIPGHGWAIMLLALAPLFRGFEHLDVRRFERHLRFAPSLLVEALPQIVITAAAWPLAAWLSDYRAVLVLLLTKGLATCLGSHVLAERPYRWQMHWPYMVRMWRFGWPLVVNGFLLFGVLQGDQFLVAARYAMAELGPYAAAAALTMAPTFFFGRVFNSVMLPILAKVQDDPVAFERRYRQVLAVITLFTTVSSLGMIVGGEALMRMVYGANYVGAGVLLAWLSAANAFRNLRLAPALAAIARGDSRNQMIQNSWRVISLVPAAAFALTQQPLWWIACTGLLGEAPACWVSFHRLRRRDAIPLLSNLVSAAWIALGAVVAGALALLVSYEVAPLFGLSLAALAACIGAGLTVAAFPELRREAYNLHTHWRRTGWRGCLSDFGMKTSHKAAASLQ